MRLLKPLILALFGLLASVGLAQIPAPQINLSGNIGCQGFPCLNNGILPLSTDANHTMTAQETSALAVNFTSSVSLTATRNMIYPAGRFGLDACNFTTGGQSIQIIGVSGSGVMIANGSCTRVWNNGTNFLQIGASGGGAGFPFLLGSTSIPGTTTVTAVNGLTLDGVTPTTFGYLDATSSIQTQLNSLAPLTSPTFLTGITSPAITLSTATGSTQCLQVNTSGVVAPTGTPCGSGGGGITALTGDVTASGSGSVTATVKGINGTILSGLATGILKNTTGTGVPSIATAGTDYQVPITQTIFNTFLTSPGAIGGTSPSTGAFTTVSATSLNAGGLVKSSPSFGVLSTAVVGDVIDLWTGTCSSSTFLRGDGACASAPGATITINGGSSLSTANFNGTTPAAGSGFQNSTFQVSGNNVSVENPLSSSSVFGLAKVDGTTITASGGVISAVTGGSGTVSDGSGTTTAGQAAISTTTAHVIGYSNAPAFSAANLISFPTLNQNTTGSAAKLTTARNINGVAFDGSANITITAVPSGACAGALAGTFPNCTIAGLGSTAGFLPQTDGAGNLLASVAQISPQNFLELPVVGINIIGSFAPGTGPGNDFGTGFYWSNTYCGNQFTSYGADTGDSENGVYIGHVSPCFSGSGFGPVDTSFMQTTGAIHNQVGGTAATITNIAITSNVVTVTASNSFTTSSFVLFQGLTTVTALNTAGGLAVQSATSTQFTVNFTNANVSSTTETGTAQPVVDNVLNVGHEATGVLNLGPWQNPFIVIRSGLLANGIFLPLLTSQPCLGTDSNGKLGAGTCGSAFTPQTNGTNNATLTGINFINSTANTVGLTITASNPGTTQEKFEITGASYTGNAATATNLAGTFTAHQWYGNNSASTASPAPGLIGTSDWSPNAYAAGAGSVNVMTIALTPAATALTSGLVVWALPNLANTTTTPTLNVSSLGSKTITKCGTTALVASDYTTTALAEFIYDGTEFQLMNPQAVGCAGGAVTFSAITGSTNTTATMVVGAGASLNFASTGTINASTLAGNAIGTSGATLCLMNAACSATAGWTFSVAPIFLQASSIGSAADGAILYNSSSTNNSGVALDFQARNASFTTFKGAEIVETMTSATAGSEVTNLALKTWNLGAAVNALTLSGAGNATVLANMGAASFSTATNCASSASPAVCGSASAGAFTIAATTTSIVVNTSAVTANSEIEITPDSSLGTRLSVTCNTSLATVIGPVVTARSAGTSFTVSITGTLVTNPACYTYSITN